MSAGHGQLRNVSVAALAPIMYSREARNSVPPLVGTRITEIDPAEANVVIAARRGPSITNGTSIRHGASTSVGPAMNVVSATWLRSVGPSAPGAPHGVCCDWPVPTRLHQSAP